MKRSQFLFAALLLASIPLPCRAGEPEPPAPLEEKVKRADFIVIGKASKVVSKKYMNGDRYDGGFSMQLDVSEVLFPPQFVAPTPWKLQISQSSLRTSDARSVLKEGEPMIFLLCGSPDNKGIHHGPVDATHIAYPLANRDRVVELLKQRPEGNKPR